MIHAIPGQRRLELGNHLVPAAIPPHLKRIPQGSGSAHLGLPGEEAAVAPLCPADRDAHGAQGGGELCWVAGIGSPQRVPATPAQEESAALGSL